MSKIGRFRVWADQLAACNAATGRPTSATNGVGIPALRENETAHLLVTKQNVADFAIHGYDANVPAWFQIDKVSFSEAVTAGLANANEATRILGITGYSRIAAQRTDANVSNSGCNVFWAFSE